MQNRSRLAVLLLTVGFAFLPRLASAQVTLTFSNPSLFGAPGDTVTFFGTFANTSLTETYKITGFQINDVFFKIPGYTQLPISDSSSNSEFMVSNGIPVQYAPGSSFTGAIFSLTIAPSAVAGAYPQLPSYYSVLYQFTDVNTGTTIASNPGPSGTSITVVPEPSTAGFLATTITGFGLFSRRTRRGGSAKQAV